MKKLGQVLIQLILILSIAFLFACGGGHHRHPGDGGDGSDIYHPSILLGSWNYEAIYDSSSGEDPSQWDWSGPLILNDDGSVTEPPRSVQGFWWSYWDIIIICHYWDEPDYGYYGVDCSFLNFTSPNQASGLFEDKNLSGTGWWGRGNASMAQQDTTTGSSTINYHPSNLQGVWKATFTYTSSSDGDPSQWNWSGSLTLGEDGLVTDSNFSEKGYWWSYNNMLIVAHPWTEGPRYGVDCSFLNLTSPTQASGLFEDKNLSGTGWWGRGNIVMNKQ